MELQEITPTYLFYMRHKMAHAKTKNGAKKKTRAEKRETGMSQFNIAEKLFLLAIAEDEGKLVDSLKQRVRYGLAGALLAELALSGKIQLQDGRLLLVDTALSGEPLFDEIVSQIASEVKPRKLSRWIQKIGSKRTLRLVANRLEEQLVISVEKKRYLLVLPYEVYAPLDATAKYWVKQHLRGLVLASGKTNTSDVALLSLLKACRLLRLVFTRDERSLANKRVDELVQNEKYGEAVAQFLEEIEQAAIAAALAAG
jgi:hypothetical protein